MKKWLVFGIFWFLWQVPFGADPQLVEARSPTSKQEFRSETKYCDGHGNCSSSSSFSQSKQWDRPSGNFSSGGGYYYTPTPSGGGMAPQINVPIDFRPLANALECVVTFLFGGCQSAPAPAPAPSP